MDPRLSFVTLVVRDGGGGGELTGLGWVLIRMYAHSVGANLANLKEILEA